MAYSSRGKHVLVDFYGVSAEKLRNRRALMVVLCRALRQAGFSILRKTGSHQFKNGGQGVTGFALLAESHAAFHSYPEKNYLALDIYTCGAHDPQYIANAIEAYLMPKATKRFMQKRG